MPGAIHQLLLTSSYCGDNFTFHIFVVRSCSWRSPKKF